MKCPKCAYLGFETGDRCKNCGYDFSLLAASEPEPDYDLHVSGEGDVLLYPIDDMDSHNPWLENRRDPLGGQHGPEPSSRDHVDDVLTLTLTPDAPFSDEPIIQLDSGLDDEPVHELSTEPIAPIAPTAALGPIAGVAHFAPPLTSDALPLFAPAEEQHDDEPLIKLPATPRPPLQVRRTPDTPRLRAVPRPVSRPSNRAPVLQFSEEAVERSVPVEEKVHRLEPGSAGVHTGDSSRPARRLIAAAIDHAILTGIDIGVVYFTVRMAGLSITEWSLLPVVPMLTFLALLKVSYFYAFTAVGGQTIGKMAAGTCVVADDGRAVDAARAMRRTCAAVLSFLLLGLGFVPALFGERRALHDRLAGTRVIRLRSV